MITIKNKMAIQKMARAGRMLAGIFVDLTSYISSGVTTHDIDNFVAQKLKEAGMVSKMKGYRGYKHVTCVSLNDQVVHGIPSKSVVITDGDLVKVDVCAAFDGYCADMARPFVVGKCTKEIELLIEAAQVSLDAGIAQAYVGKRLTDISAAIQCEIEKYGFSVVRDFAGHGIGKQMHEDPEILNYGAPGRGPVLYSGMAFAIEPMLNQGAYQVYIGNDGWTVYTQDKSIAMHIEDTIAITDNGPQILTRL